MKTITIKTFATGIVATMLLFMSCTKDGPAGPQGPAGTNGTNGVANISINEAFTQPSQWSNSGGLWRSSFTVSSLTDATNDAVMVYVLVPGSTQWFALPTSNLLVSGDNLEFSYAVNTVTIYYSLTGTPTSGIWQFKMVVIPPASRLANPNVNLNNYEEVKAAYHLR